MNIVERAREMEPEKRRKLIERIYSDGDKYGIYPLTDDQYLLWCGYVAQINSVHYSNPGIVVRMKNISHEKCLNLIDQLRQLQDPFRYKYAQIDEYVFQYLDNDSGYDVIENDISDVLPEKREEYIGRFIREFYMLPMDITENFPVLFELIKVADDEFILFVCMHHIIGDSISAGAVYKDICSILSDSAVKSNYQCGRYAMYKNSSSGRQAEMDNVEYWAQEIKDVPKFTGIPTDFSRTSDASEVSGIVERKISEDVYKYLKEKAAKDRGSVYNILVSVFSLVIQEYSMKKSILIGTTFFNRNDERLSQVVGDFATVVPYAFYKRDDITLNEYFKENMHNFKEAMEHCDVTITNIQQKFPFDRTKQYFPLYQVIFLYEGINLLGGTVNNVNGVTLELSSLTDDERQDDFKMDMFIEAVDMGNSCVIRANYSRKLFRHESIENLMDVYIGLINNIRKFENARLVDICMVSSDMNVSEKIIKTDKIPCPVRKADIMPDDNIVYSSGNNRICILNDNNIPVPVNFYGCIYVLSNGEWYCTGKTGKVNLNGELEICEERSDIVLFKGENIDIVEASRCLSEKYSGLNFRFMYFEGKLVLNYYGRDDIMLSYMDIRNVCGFIPDLLYRTENYDKMYMIHHQKNIISACERFCKAGFDTLAVQRKNDVTEIIICGYDEKVMKQLAEEIYDDIMDNKITFAGVKASYDEVLAYGNNGYDKSNTIMMTLPVETEKISEIWKEVIGHDTFGVYDDFFEVGGNSVRIVKLCSQINKCYGLNIHISVLYENSTVYSQAEYICKLKKDV